VAITVRVHHTTPDGSGATLITSATTTITSTTSDPLALDLGSALAQTFTSADPRRLRMQIEITGVTSGASFVLDYDGTCATSRCSSLDTPVVVVPEGAVALAAVGLLIPLVTAGAWRRRRLAERARQAASPVVGSRRRPRRGPRKPPPGPAGPNSTRSKGNAHSRPPV
jgi:hypothetical protein